VIDFEFIGRKNQGGTDMIWGFYWERKIDFENLTTLPEVIVFRGHFGKKITLQRKLRTWDLLCRQGDMERKGYKAVSLTEVEADWPSFVEVVTI
jgi:hypothetical protein